MITEKQCIQESQKLNNLSFDFSSSGIEPLELLARMRGCGCDDEKKGEILSSIQKIATSLPDNDLPGIAECAFALAEAAALNPDGCAANEQAQLMADRILRSKESVSGDYCASAAALLMALQNSHLPPFMRPAYIGHARIFAKRALDMGDLSPMGEAMLKLSLEKLIGARRKYQW